MQLKQELAQVYVAQNKLPEAKILIDSLYRQQVGFSNTIIVASSCLVFGKYLMKKNSVSEAIHHYSMALDTFTRIKSIPDIICAQSLLSEAYVHIKRFDVAYQFLKDNDKLKSDLAEKNEMDLTYAMESRYQLREKNQTISTLNLDNQAKTASLKSSRRNIILLVIGLGLVSLLSIFAFNLAQTKRVQAQELREKKRAN
ncbi:MAG: hypothetical protein HC817_03480 [Saprospiraceae bacterium]|nr:hypothetical protein [Saprospiraceae bacterium]